MIIQQYSVNQHPIQTLLTWIESGEIAIPEIQRPFVWNATKVRDLMDSLYCGYPVGYLITWRNPNVKLKDGSLSIGKRILIDGQQRITALMAALLGRPVLNKNYTRHRIAIAFHPLERKFEVSNPAIKKDKTWIPDIFRIFAPDFKLLREVEDYCRKNAIKEMDGVLESLESLRGIVNNPIGLIELNSNLDIEKVTDIFIRINSTGVNLGQADFAMSKIAVDETYGGNTLRKAIDYFCRLAVAPEFYKQLVAVDQEFAGTDYFNKMAWLKNENDDLYDPSYTDMLRVAFTYKFTRGRLQDLVALLSGRNFQTKAYEAAIAEHSFDLLRQGVMSFMNENSFKKFVMILNSAGFINSSLIRSRNAINFAYVLYLFLRERKFNQARIESLVRKWFVLSVLTKRYSSSPESQFDFDIKRMKELDPEAYIENVIAAQLSDAFWDVGLPQQLNTSVASSPAFNVFLAAQVKLQDKGFLSRDITVHDLITHRGDVHHIFPRAYLKRHGLERGSYNQVANYVMTQSEINIAIGDKSPKEYFKEIREQCNGSGLKYGGINSINGLFRSLEMNCIPREIFDMDVNDYDIFLEKRRKLMAQKVKIYFNIL